MARIASLTPGQLSPEQGALYAQIAGGPRARGPQHFAIAEPDGALRGPFNALLLEPALGAAVQELGSAIRYRGNLTDRTREIAILLVATHWDSAFERASHEAVGRAAGLTETELEALRTGDLEVFIGDEAVAAEVTAELVRGDLRDATWAQAERTLGAEVVFELTTLVGYYSLLALQLRVFRVDT